MSDRFDFLEIGDAKPALYPPPPAYEPPFADPPARRASDRIVAVESIGEQGDGPGQFNSPIGLTVDRGGSLYVADSGNQRVLRITVGGEVFVYGRPGTASGQMSGPQAVAVEATGRFFFVAEQGTHRVHCFNCDSGMSHGFITGFRAPSGVAFDPDGMLWIADTGNSRLLRLDARSGQFIGNGIGPEQGIQRPSCVACDAGGCVYVVESVAQDVVRYDRFGRRLSAVSDFRTLAQPRAVAVDSVGRLYVAETGANRLHVLDAEGCSIAVFDSPASHIPLRSPAGVAIGPSDEIYLADTLNHRVLRLAWE